MEPVTNEINVPVKLATFSMACFWAPDCLFGVTKGVVRTRVGYSGGVKNNPVYRNLGDHTESIQIEYDPTVISYSVLLDLFWKNHDPTFKTKRQYTSLVFYHDDEQKALAEDSLKKEQQRYQDQIVTEILPASEFFDAEDYHQKYRLRQHPWLCKEVGLISPTDFKRTHLAALLNGYVYGYGEMKQFNEDVKSLGLKDDVADYIRTLIKKYEGQGHSC